MTPFSKRWSLHQSQYGSERRFALEREHRLEPHIEVVLLGARSEDVLKRTHARYFKTVRELVDSA